jgi:hypothetical protein
MSVFAADVGLLLQVVWVSLVAGVGVSALFSLVIVGGAKASEARRTGRDHAALAYTMLAVLAFAIFAVGVGFGVKVMLTK